ncbi:MAG: PD-(D/E)XK nuclease family protein [Methylophilaceae bacterium]
MAIAATIAAMAENTLAPIICSTARLARSLKMAQNRMQRDQGRTQWQPLPTMTLTQWLQGLMTQAQLAGEIAAGTLPSQALSALSERLLWERAIDLCMPDNAQAVLFDRAGLAQSAADANALLLEWNIDLPQSWPAAAYQAEETRQFMRWREAFRQLCHEYQVLESARLLEAQIVCLEKGAGRLPKTIYLAGYDRISPLEQRLFNALAARGVHVELNCFSPHLGGRSGPATDTARAINACGHDAETWAMGLAQAATAMQASFDNAEGECRAAVAWAQQHLTANSEARIAIVVPELGALRARLMAILDDTLHPETVHPALAESPRCYDFSLGEPLPLQPLIGTALALLRLAVSRYRLAQQECGWLLRSPHWSAAITEADARARLEARMRRKLGGTIRLEQMLRLARKAGADGSGVMRLVQHLEALNAEAAAWSRKQSPSAWAQAFAQMLKGAGWPGERGLSSHEFQARQAWLEALQEFAVLDHLLGKLSSSEALRRLAHLCQQRIFQPESAGEPRLQVMGMLETASAPLDAIWVMGMNDHIWPPPARPNALLPASAQRQAHAPNACSAVQAEFAQTIHRRLLHTAPLVMFSWARKQGERELRPSPLLSGIPHSAVTLPAVATLAEQLAQPAAMQKLHDALAPAVAEGEQVLGGAGLLRAQAICPAWAYYQFRLGARALDEPADGLDDMARGSLLHAVLQCFWSGAEGKQLGSAELQAMDETMRQNAIAVAIEAGVSLFSKTLEEPLPAQFLALEKLRLQALLAIWLEVEQGRAAFSVQECERRVRLEVGGIVADLVLDRIDALDDGRLVVIDYKTGASISHYSWAEDRISEPQLPIYAALALSGGEVAAVCFAKVRVDECKFIGIAAQPDILPGIEALENARKRFPEARFPDWSSLLQHWKISLEAIAGEIRRGEAAVCYADEKDLDYCDVKPLLRLSERKLQFEQYFEQTEASA